MRKLFRVIWNTVFPKDPLPKYYLLVVFNTEDQSITTELFYTIKEAVKSYYDRLLDPITHDAYVVNTRDLNNRRYIKI